VHDIKSQYNTIQLPYNLMVYTVLSKVEIFLSVVLLCFNIINYIPDCLIKLTVLYCSLKFLIFHVLV